MYTGKLIEDLFDAVEKAERSARMHATQNYPPPRLELNEPGSEMSSEPEGMLTTK